ncbi:hypothetical protein CAXC1_330083 [Candidatus Xenohaliotis californiensis]|uniref:Uncharacterized protein n=1 Tax=Candidatus Xenohaliotis californiensis TaxID=84677 RepID=A0ABM9N9K8_9RICK|nr:hypothetical protein CAXC1_330083 [Candidatus Xenohaliotis californiensis]
MPKKIFNMTQSVLNLDDLYYAFIYHKPKNRENCKSNYQAILHKLIQDGADVYLDTEDNINVILHPNSKLIRDLNTALEKMKENSKIDYKNTGGNQVVFPAKMLHNRRNMNIMLNELAENDAEQSLRKAVTSIAENKILDTQKKTNISNAVTLAMAIMTVVGATLLGLGLILAPAIIIAASSTIAIGAISYKHYSRSKLNTVEKSDYKMMKKIYDNLIEVQYEHVQDKKMSQTKKQKNFKKIAYNAKVATHTYSR